MFILIIWFLFKNLHSDPQKLYRVISIGDFNDLWYLYKSKNKIQISDLLNRLLFLQIFSNRYIFKMMDVTSIFYQIFYNKNAIN